MAHQVIKKLVKDHRYDYIETGSLISIRKNTKDIIIPSAETRINMYPRDYEEFRWALEDSASIPLLRQFYEKRVDAVKREILELYFDDFVKKIDFLLSRGTKIWPLEVKSSGYRTHESLDEFCRKFSDRVGNRYLVYTKELLVPVHIVR